MPAISSTFVERGVTAAARCLAWRRGPGTVAARQGVDTFGAGNCTHYPMLSGLIQLAMGDSRHVGVQRRGDRQRLA